MAGVPVADASALERLVAASPFPALEAVGALDVPRRALRHRYVLEARALATVLSGPEDDRRERVIGTENKRAPHAQLYGWSRDVEAHRDGTGWIYFCPIIVGCTLVFAGDLSVLLHAGTVYRLNDFAEHWTRDSDPVVCLFAGVFDHPADARARRMLNRGAWQLAAGCPHAPRVSLGFRVPLEGECYADNCGGGRRLVKVAQARRKGWPIAECAVCDLPAVRLDRHWPYHQDHNRCPQHLSWRMAQP